MKRFRLLVLMICCSLLICKTLKENGAEIAALEKQIENSYSMGNYRETEFLFLKILEIRRELQPAGKHPDYASSLNDLAALYTSLGNYSKAEPLFLQALEIRKTLPPEKNSDYAESLNNLAYLYVFMGNYNKAEPLYLKALEIRETLLPEKNSDYAGTLNNLAYLYTSMGNYSKAEPLYHQALDIRKSLQPEGKHPDYAESLNGLAGLYRIMGNYNKAEPLYLQAMNIYKILQPEGKHRKYATSCNNLALLYENTGNYSKAEPLYLQAINIYKTLQPEGKHPYYATSLNNLALLYTKTGNYNKAEPLYFLAMDIYKTLKPEGKHPNYAYVLNNIASLYEAMGNYSKAEPLYLQALEIRKAIPPEGKHPDCAASFKKLALLYFSMGNYDKAELFLLRSLSISREFLHKNFSTISEKEKEKFLTILSERFESFYSLLEKQLPVNPRLAGTAADLQLFSKAILFRSSQALRRRIQSSNDSRLIADYDSWLGLRRQINKAYELTQEQRKSRLIDLGILEEATNKLEKSLVTRSEEFRLACEQKEHTWQEVRSALKSGEAAVNLVRYRLRNKKWTDTIHYAVTIIKPDSLLPEIFFLENGNVIEKKVIPLYRNFISDPLNTVFTIEDTDVWATLYAHLWKPVAVRLADIQRVYFSPDGVFNLINPETLQWSSGRWLADKEEIIRITSLSDLIKKPFKTPGKAGPALLVGYPLYDLDEETHRKAVKKYFQDNAYPGYEKITFRSTDLLYPLSPLPGTREEVETLAALFRQKGEFPEVRLEEAALEECIKAIESPRVLHLATHAFFQEDLEYEGDREETAQSAEDPLLRSGIMLTGAAHTLQGEAIPGDMENGILTSKEAIDLNLDNTELVVLSGCETGLGVVKNGEGVYGLQRAFLVAGADAVLMSLWKVDDRVSRDFMSEFYRNWLSGKKKRQAYKDTVQWLRKSHPEPFYWGAFVLVGE